jgi:LPS export ABC transporter protein LptC
MGAGGCGAPQVQRDEKTPPFVFRSLDLRQQDERGRPAWELTSREARYDLRRNVARAIDPRGVIFRDGQPAYRIQATSALVVNDGEVIQLEGTIRMEQLGRQPVLVEASQVRWLPRLEQLLIDHHPRATDAYGQLRAERARFLLRRGQLELRGAPRLLRWREPINPFSATRKDPPVAELNVSRADWEPATGQLETVGPVQGRHWPEGRSRNQAPQTLTASDLDGNTIRQLFQLAGPVRLHDPLEAAELVTAQLSLDLREQTASSATPFRGSLGKTRLEGTAFLIQGKEHVVAVGPPCRIEQPGESLQARQCSWNWQTRDIGAAGGVVLQRSNNRQLSRGERLVGTLGEGGGMVLETPSGRVVSSFQVPGGAKPRQAPKPRPKPDPIRL